MQTKRNPQANDITAGLDKILRRSRDEQNLHRPSSGHEFLLHLQGLFYLALLISQLRADRQEQKVFLSYETSAWQDKQTDPRAAKV